MKKIARLLTPLFAVALLPLLSTIARADDVADAKTEFAKFIDLQKSNDLKVLDLFSKTITVKITMTDGKQSQTQVMPTDAFLQQTKDSIAKKEEMKDKYSNITAKQDGDTVLVQCTLTLAELGGKEVPFEAVYIHEDGKLKVKEFRMTLTVPAQPAPDAPPTGAAPAPVPGTAPAVPADPAK